MISRKRFVRVVAVLAVAVAAGQVVETLRTPHGKISETSMSVDAAVVVSGLSQRAADSDLPALQGITPVAATAEGLEADRCVPTLSLVAAPSAMIELSLSAPCNRAERVVIRHAGLSFTAKTGPEGKLRLQMPALQADAMVAAYFNSAQIALASVLVPEAADIVRFAVQMGHPFDLRADEGGQVYVGSPGLEAQSLRMATLGSAKVTQPLAAQVYSFPGADIAATDLTVEVKITPETCGRTIPMETLLARGGKVTVTQLSVSVPLCGTSGDILVLKNLLRDMTLASPE